MTVCYLPFCGAGGWDHFILSLPAAFLQFSCTLWAYRTNRPDFWGPGALGITHKAPIPCAGPRLRQGARLTHFNSLQAARASCVYADTKHTRELERQRSSRVIVLTTHHPPGPLRIRKGRVAAVYCPRAAPTRALSLDARLLYMYARSRRNGVEIRNASARIRKERVEVIGSLEWDGTESVHRLVSHLSSPRETAL